MAKKYLFVDAFNLTARLRYVFWPDGVIFNPSDYRLVQKFIYSLSKMVEDMQPDRVVLTPDPNQYKRTEFFPEYKAQRQGCEIYNHHKALCVLLAKMTLPINVVEIPGYEADDIIARYAESLEGEKIIITTDNDLLQVVQHCENTRLYNPIKKEFMEVKHPDVNTIHLKALIGDTGDNIPSVTGEVTSLKMLRGEKNLDEWLDGGVTRSEKLPRREVYERNLTLVSLLGEHALLPQPALPDLSIPPMNLGKLKTLCQEKLKLGDWVEEREFARILSIWKFWYARKASTARVIPRGQKVHKKTA